MFNKKKITSCILLIYPAPDWTRSWDAKPCQPKRHWPAQKAFFWTKPTSGTKNWSFLCCPVPLLSVSSQLSRTKWKLFLRPCISIRDVRVTEEGICVILCDWIYMSNIFRQMDGLTFFGPMQSGKPRGGTRVNKFLLVHPINFSFHKQHFAERQAVRPWADWYPKRFPCLSCIVYANPRFPLLFKFVQNYEVWFVLRLDIDLHAAECCIHCSMWAHTYTWGISRLLYNHVRLLN